jgi:hypothetical protein
MQAMRAPMLLRHRDIGRLNGREDPVPDNDMDRVVPLGQLDDYRVAEGEPDVRGWEVLASDGRKIGEVDELLVDTAAMKVRYLDVDVEDGMVAGGHDRHVLIPIGYARLDEERDCVRLDAMASSELGGVPAYDQGPLTRDFESSVRESFSARRPTPSQGLMDGAGMMDTAGLDNTPGIGTGLGMTGTAGGMGASDAGTGMRAGASDVDERGSQPGSAGPSAGAMPPLDDGLRGGERMSAGSQGPVGGVEREEMRGDAPRGTGLAGSDYMHGSADDFYAGDAFDDARFYGSRRGGSAMGRDTGSPAGGTMGPGGGTGGVDDVDQLRGSGLDHHPPTLHGAGQEGVGASPEETRRLAGDARELLREDLRNRDVGGAGNP